MEQKQKKILKGTPARLGRAKGKVVVILSPSECDRVQEGDILVTFMTDPNYMPAMKRAAAIVTDIGGVLCHAAIVSRELKKPCIVNTKNATEALKNGQIISVDAMIGEIYEE